jgi:hypothetical protein
VVARNIHLKEKTWRSNSTEEVIVTDSTSGMGYVIVKRLAERALSEARRPLAEVQNQRR